MNANTKIASIIIITANLLFINILYGQTGAVSISDEETYTPSGSAMLDVYSSKKGVLFCRLSYDAMMLIENPADALLVYVTDEGNEGYWFFNQDEEEWVKLPAFDQNEPDRDYSVQTGCIIMFTGPRNGNFDADGVGVFESEMEGWALCDGNNGRPNLTGSFILGWGNGLELTVEGITDRNDYDGTNFINLQEENLPVHNHVINPIEYELSEHRHKIMEVGRHTHEIRVRKKGIRGDKQISTVKDDYSGDCKTYEYSHAFLGNQYMKRATDIGKPVFAAYPEGIETEEYTKEFEIEEDKPIQVSPNVLETDQEEIDNRPEFFVVAFVIKL